MRTLLVSRGAIVFSAAFGAAFGALWYSHLLRHSHCHSHLTEKKRRSRKLQQLADSLILLAGFGKSASTHLGASALGLVRR